MSCAGGRRLLARVRIGLVLANTRGWTYQEILSVSKIMYPFGSLGNNKETQQAPEPSNSDYIIVT